MQVADVNKVLMAVNQLVDAGNYVHFEQENNHIYNYSTGYRTDMDEVNGQYTSDMWVPNLGTTKQEQPKRHSGRYAALESLNEEDDNEPSEPFQRQER